MPNHIMLAWPGDLRWDTTNNPWPIRTKNVDRTLIDAPQTLTPRAGVIQSYFEKHHSGGSWHVRAPLIFSLIIAQEYNTDTSLNQVT